MNRRRVFLVSTLLSGLIALAIFFWPTRPQLFRAKFELVQEGRTLEQVTEIVGVPPGVYIDQGRSNRITGGGYDSRHYSHEWACFDGTLHVIFSSADHRAIHVQISDPQPDGRSAWRRIRDRLGL